MILHKMHLRSRIMFLPVGMLLMTAVAGLGWRAFRGSGAVETSRDAAAVVAFNPLDVTVEPVSVEHDAKPVGGGKKVYTHPAYGFSIEYPAELRVLTFDEGGKGETILFQHASDTEVGFQVFITPYTGQIPLTAERIREVQPFTDIRSPQNVDIAGVPAVLFWSVTEIGQTREVWFVREGFLYSVTTYADLDAWLSQIMATWTFP